MTYFVFNLIKKIVCIVFSGTLCKLEPNILFNQITKEYF
jgi:hypothetical protein